MSDETERDNLPENGWDRKVWRGQNRETGEVTDWGVGIKIIQDYGKSYERKQWYNNALAKYGKLQEIPIGSYAKVNKTEYAHWQKVLEPGEKALLLDLSRFVSGFDCRLQNGSRPIVVSHMCNITQMSDKTVRKHLSSLMQKKIICQSKTSRYAYYMNPWIIGYGKYLSPVPLSLFQDYRILSEGGITWKEWAKERGVEF